MQDRHANDEQDQKFQEAGQRASGLVLFDEQKQNRPDKADSERVKHIGIYVPSECGRDPERHAGCFTSSASAEIRWQPPYLLTVADGEVMSPFGSRTWINNRNIERGIGEIEMNADPKHKGGYDDVDRAKRALKNTFPASDPVRL